MRVSKDRPATCSRDPENNHYNQIVTPLYHDTALRYAAVSIAPEAPKATKAPEDIVLLSGVEGVHAASQLKRRLQVRGQ